VTGGCKHISALVLFVNNDSAQSKTSHENAWKGAVASTKKASSAKYKKGKRIADMYPPVTRKNVYQALELPPRQINLQINHLELSKLERILNFLKNLKQSSLMSFFQK
jgi:hypothetical protein